VRNESVETIESLVEHGTEELDVIEVLAVDSLDMKDDRFDSPYCLTIARASRFSLSFSVLLSRYDSRDGAVR